MFLIKIQESDGHLPAAFLSILRISFSLANLSFPRIPALIIGHCHPTARCAIVLSIVSPERCEIIGVILLSFAKSTILFVSSREPFWFGLTMRALMHFSLTAISTLLNCV